MGLGFRSQGATTNVSQIGNGHGSLSKDYDRDSTNYKRDPYVRC